jgi:cell division protein FtsB
MNEEWKDLPTLPDVGAAQLEGWEIERLKTVPMRYRRLAFNAKLQDENDKLRQQLVASRQQVTLLRDGIIYAEQHCWGYEGRRVLSEALAATEPK